MSGAPGFYAWWLDYNERQGSPTAEECWQGGWDAALDAAAQVVKHHVTGRGSLQHQIAAAIRGLQGTQP